MLAAQWADYYLHTLDAARPHGSTAASPKFEFEAGAKAPHLELYVGPDSPHAPQSARVPISVVDQDMGKQWAQYYVHALSDASPDPSARPGTAAEEPVKPPVPSPSAGAAAPPRAPVPPDPAPAAPRLLYVTPKKGTGGSGILIDPFHSLSDAVAAATPGSTIRLLPGRHPPAAVTAPPPGLVIRGSADGVATVPRLTLRRARDATVQGLTFEGKVGVRALECPGLQLRDNVFDCLTPVVGPGAPGEAEVAATNVVLPQTPPVPRRDLLLYGAHCGCLVWAAICTGGFYLATAAFFHRDVDRWLAGVALALGVDFVLQFAKCLVLRCAYGAAETRPLSPSEPHKGPAGAAPRANPIGAMPPPVPAFAGKRESIYVTDLEAYPHGLSLASAPAPVRPAPVRAPALLVS